MPKALSIPATKNALLIWLTAILGIGAIGAVDFFTGVELRVLPLYFAPISFIAWHIGRSGAVLAAALSAVCWLTSNLWAGLEFSHPTLWVANTLVQGSAFAIVGTLIATLRSSLMRAQRLSRIDPLTLLLNRRAFYDEAERILALCRRQGRPVTLAYIDLDNFKTVNDVLGHQAGVELLREVGALLRASTRPSDLCARLGGDEFAILLADVDSHDATVVLERLRALLSETVASDASPVTGSIGAVTFLKVPADLEDMVRAADSRMYAAKNEGKNRLHLEIADAETQGARVDR